MSTLGARSYIHTFKHKLTQLYLSYSHIHTLQTHLKYLLELLLIIQTFFRLKYSMLILTKSQKCNIFTWERVDTIKLKT